MQLSAKQTGHFQAPPTKSQDSSSEGIPPSLQMGWTALSSPRARCSCSSPPFHVSTELLFSLARSAANHSNHQVEIHIKNLLTFISVLLCCPCSSLFFQVRASKGRMKLLFEDLLPHVRYPVRGSVWLFRFNNNPWNTHHQQVLFCS